jgi:DNA replication protein DnaC
VTHYRHDHANTTRQLIRRPTHQVVRRHPARKSLEDFDFDHARGLKRDLIAHLGTLDFVAAKDNVVFLGPPGTGKTHCSSASPPANKTTASATRHSW